MKGRHIDEFRFGSIVFELMEKRFNIRAVGDCLEYVLLLVM